LLNCEASNLLLYLILILWAHDKVNPTRIEPGAVPGNGEQAHCNNEKPEVANMATHLSEPGFTDQRVPQNFFIGLFSALSLGRVRQIINTPEPLPA